MYEWIIYCEDSLEGVFTAIYETYEFKYNHERTYIQAGEILNYKLAEHTRYSEADPEKTRKVAGTVLREFGMDCYKLICRALASYEEFKADSVYHMIVYGLSMKKRRNLLNDLSNSYVLNVFKMKIEVCNEIHHLYGFLRFTEIENGLLLAKIGPKNNIITFLAAHFEDRFPLENFAIYDETRELFAVHPAGKQFIIVTGEKIDENVFNHISREEELYQELFKTFWKCIAIQGRKNQKLQTQMLPLRFRDYMMEFR